jgi:hypothetical protein
LLQFFLFVVPNENTPFFSRQQLPAAGFNFHSPHFFLKSVFG